jgi:hypothetical protein
LLASDFRFSALYIHCIPALLVATSWFQKSLPCQSFGLYSAFTHSPSAGLAPECGNEPLSQFEVGLGKFDEEIQQHLQMPVRLLSTGNRMKIVTCFFGNAKSSSENSESFRLVLITLQVAHDCPHWPFGS